MAYSAAAVSLSNGKSFLNRDGHKKIDVFFLHVIPDVWTYYVHDNKQPLSNYPKSECSECTGAYNKQFEGVQPNSRLLLITLGNYYTYTSTL